MTLSNTPMLSLKCSLVNFNTSAALLFFNFFKALWSSFIVINFDGSICSLTFLFIAKISLCTTSRCCWSNCSHYRGSARFPKWVAHPEHTASGVSHTVPLTTIALTLLLFDFLCWFINFANVVESELEFIIFSTLSILLCAVALRCSALIFFLASLLCTFNGWSTSFGEPHFFHSHHVYFDLFTALSILSFQILCFAVLTFILSLYPGTLPTTALFSTEVICPNAHKNSNSVLTSSGNRPISLLIISLYFLWSHLSHFGLISIVLFSTLTMSFFNFQFCHYR